MVVEAGAVELSATGVTLLLELGAAGVVEVLGFRVT